ncbi:hypothetical protein EDC04DRAFT_2742223 [Pisolithus marmoratus]|nr:hypothetical protein EDC04DRAFT_2742223 [Pisolithus marmoratus]
MERTLKGTENLDMKKFESDMLSWFPKHQKSSDLDFIPPTGGITGCGWMPAELFTCGMIGFLLLAVLIIDICDGTDFSGAGINSVPIAAFAEHGIEFLLIIEYCYFLFEQSFVDTDVIPHAVKEYKTSGIAPIINQAIETSIQEHGQNVANLCQAFVTIILDNHMCECMCPVFAEP